MQTKIHDELKAFADEIAEVNQKIGRLETLKEIQNMIQAQADKSKSVYEIKALHKLLEKLQELI